MKITIITINYNNLKGIERTFYSVDSQIVNGFDLEYVVVDGSSDDGSAQYIKDFCFSNKVVNYKFIIEKDNGISDAFNKGIRMSSGDYILMLNSGDILEGAECLCKVHKSLMNFGNDLPDLLYGDVLNSFGNRVGGQGKITRALEPGAVPHQGAFVKAKCYYDCGLYDTTFKIRMDYDFFSRFKKANKSWEKVDYTVAKFEMGGVSNLQSNRVSFYKEALKVDTRDKNKSILRNLVRYIYYCIKA